MHHRIWDLPESMATPEALMLNRRAALAGLGVGLGLAGLMRARPARAAEYPPGRAITPETNATTYNNYYEFGTDKDIWPQAQKMPLSPWQVRIDGLVAKPKSWDIDALLKALPPEQRIYRHRCVEAWAMTVPWTGFPLAALLALAEPAADARYVQFETAQKPDVMPGLDNPVFSWPYTEAVTIAEAGNELAFIATGLYGKPLTPQNGGPIRLVLPWKYGFKSAKSLARITLTSKRPDTFWAEMQPSEYGFWANVNPAVPHPRWSQASERLLGSNEQVPTRIYNGYGEQVAGLYAGLSQEKLFM